MNKFLGCLALVVTSAAACTVAGDSTVFSSDAVVLDVRCAADTDCPTGFECEVEVEHGVDVSYCVAHDSDAAASGSCPAGFELEEEHGGTFCKPHGGGQSGKGGGDDT